MSKNAPTYLGINDPESFFVCPIMEYQKDKIKNWFGNRGCQVDKIYKFGLIKDWLFIQQTKNHTVELYYLCTEICELYDEFESKGFDWLNLELNLPDDEINC